MPKFVVSETIHLQGGEEYLHMRPELPGLQAAVFTVLAGRVELIEAGTTTPKTLPKGKATRLHWPVELRAETFTIILVEYNATL